MEALLYQLGSIYYIVLLYNLEYYVMFVIGIAMQTLFRIACLGWKEWTPNGFITDTLYFEYRIALKNVERSFPLLFGSQPVSELMEFPVGNPEFSMMNDLTIIVVDSLGDSNIATIDVTVVNITSTLQFNMLK